MEYHFEDAGPHRLRVEDFPVWPFATFANTEAHFYQTRKKVIIEAGGERHDIRNPDREYAAAYFKSVRGDFVAHVDFRIHRATGPYGGGGLLVKKDMTEPEDDTGFGVSWLNPKYRVVVSEMPGSLRLESSEKTADAVDVGMFVNAFSSKGELCQVEFDNFTLER